MADHPEFDYAWIRDQWETLPKARVRYSYDETGWVAMLDRDYACIANLPLDPGLFMLDIVRLSAEDAGDFRRIVALVQRRYIQRFLVTYFEKDAQVSREETLAIYRQIAEACHTHDCESEGLLPGIALVHAPDGVDVVGILTALDLPHLVIKPMTPDEKEGFIDEAQQKD